jgi:hypothetical protein
VVGGKYLRVVHPFRLCCRLALVNQRVQPFFNPQTEQKVSLRNRAVTRNPAPGWVSSLNDLPHRPEINVRAQIAGPRVLQHVHELVVANGLQGRADWAWHD